MNKSEQILKLKQELQEFAIYARRHLKPNSEKGTFNEYGLNNSRFHKIMALFLEALPPEERKEIVSLYDLGFGDHRLIGENAYMSSTTVNKYSEHNLENNFMLQFFLEKINQIDEPSEFFELLAARKESIRDFRPEIFDSSIRGYYYIPAIDEQEYRNIVSGESPKSKEDPFNEIFSQVQIEHPDWEKQQLIEEAITRNNQRQDIYMHLSDIAYMFEALGNSLSVDDNTLLKIIGFLDKGEGHYQSLNSDTNKAALASGLSLEAQEKFLEDNPEMIAPAKAIIRSSMLLRERNREIQDRLEMLSKEFGISTTGIQHCAQQLGGGIMYNILGKEEEK